MINPTQSVVHLQSLLVGCKPTPSENLLKVFENCTAEVKSFVENKMQELGKKFCEAYSKKSDEGDNPSLDFGKQRLQSAQKLFYKILEMVLSDEKLKKPNFEPVSWKNVHKLDKSSLPTNKKIRLEIDLN